MTEIVHDFTLRYFHRKKSNARRNKINAEIVFFENKITLDNLNQSDHKNYLGKAYLFDLFL